ncbi:MAG: TetR/AcrR family transcriptional regulator C-terminal domain-containing protein [Pseudomonadota bacterium]
MQDDTTPETSARRKLTRDGILRAAVTLADLGGLEKLTMRRLAQNLGVEAMSLYNHVEGKEELLDGMVETVAAEFAAPGSEAPWQDAMRDRAMVGYAVLCRHEWLAGLLVARVNSGPVMLAYVDATLGCLRRAGFSYAQADRIWNALDSYVYGFTLQQLRFPFAPEDYAQAARAYLPAIDPAQLPYLHALTVDVAEARHDGIQTLSFGLDLLFDALERLPKTG